MEEACYTCAKPLGYDSYITCLYCEGTYHLTCTNVPTTLIDEVKRMPSLHWTCIGCTKAISCPRSKGIKAVWMQVGFQAALTAAVEAMKANLVPPVVQEIRDAFAGFTATQDAPQQLNSLLLPDALPNGKRRRLFRDVVAPADAMFVDNAASSVVTNTSSIVNARPTLSPTITGTDNTSTQIPTVAQPTKTEYMWLHLSRLATPVTVELVVTMVKAQLDTKDVVAFCLLKNGTLPSSVNSVTFKVRIAAALRDKALTATYWPAGLGVREFISLPSRSSQPQNRFALQLHTHHNNSYLPALPKESAPRPTEHPLNNNTPRSSQPRNISHESAPMQLHSQHNTKQSPIDMNRKLTSPVPTTTPRAKTIQTTMKQFFPE